MYDKEVYEKMRKRGWLNVILWAASALLWSGLAVWRGLGREDVLLVAMTAGIALLSLICFIINLRRLRKLLWALGRMAKKGPSSDPNDPYAQERKEQPPIKKG